MKPDEEQQRDDRDNEGGLEGKIVTESVIEGTLDGEEDQLDEGLHGENDTDVDSTVDVAVVLDDQTEHSGPVESDEDAGSANEPETNLTGEETDQVEDEGTNDSEVKSVDVAEAVGEETTKDTGDGVQGEVETVEEGTGSGDVEVEDFLDVEAGPVETSSIDDGESSHLEAKEPDGGGDEGLPDGGDLLGLLAVLLVGLLEVVHDILGLGDLEGNKEDVETHDQEGDAHQGVDAGVAEGGGVGDDTGKGGRDGGTKGVEGDEEGHVAGSVGGEDEGTKGLRGNITETNTHASDELAKDDEGEVGDEGDDEAADDTANEAENHDPTETNSLDESSTEESEDKVASAPDGVEPSGVHIVEVKALLEQGKSDTAEIIEHTLVDHTKVAGDGHKPKVLA